MKPITISAMVAGVQAGRISAVVFISLPFLQLEAVNLDCSNRNGMMKTAIQDRPRQNRTSHGDHWRFLNDSSASTAERESSVRPERISSISSADRRFGPDRHASIARSRMTSRST